MKHIYPVRHPPVPPAARRGELTSPEGEFLSRDEPVPPPEGKSQAPLPHERDESRHGQASATPRQHEVGQQAYDDTLGPIEDTDRGPVMDSLYHELVSAPSPRDEPPRKR